MISQPRRKRVQKKPNNSSKSSDYPYTSFLTLSASTLLALIFFHDSYWSFHLRREWQIGSRRRLGLSNAERCNDFCQDALATTSSPLASSAVDALLSLDKINLDDKKDEFYYRPPQNLKSRPNRLPRIIKLLVDEADDEILSRVEENRMRNKKDVIRITSISASGSSSTVAIAALAAAAIWPEKKGQHRMKTINDEWDGALRWIADWGLESNGENEVGAYKGNSVGKKKKSKHGVLETPADSSHNACVRECVNNNFKRFVENDCSILRDIVERVATLSYNGFVKDYISVQTLFTFFLGSASVFVLIYYVSGGSIISSPEKNNDCERKKALLLEDESNACDLKVRQSCQRKNPGKKSRKKKHPIHRSVGKKSSDMKSGEENGMRKGSINSLPKSSNDAFLFANEVRSKEVTTETFCRLPREGRGNDNGSEYPLTISESYNNRVEDTKWQVISRDSTKQKEFFVANTEVDNCIKGKPIEIDRNCFSLFSSEGFKTSSSVEKMFDDSSIMKGTEKGFGSIIGENLTAYNAKSMFGEEHMTPGRSTLMKSEYIHSNSLTLNEFELLSNVYKTFDIPSDQQREEACSRLRAFQTAQIEKLKKYMLKKKHLDYASSPSIPTLSNVDAPFEKMDHLSGDQLLLSNMLDEDENVKYSSIWKNDKDQHAVDKVSYKPLSGSCLSSFLHKSSEQFSWGSLEKRSDKCSEKKTDCWGHADSGVTRRVSYPWSVSYDTQQDVDHENLWG